MGKTDDGTRAIIINAGTLQDRKQQLDEEVWQEIEQYTVSWKPERRSSTLTRKFGNWYKGGKAVLTKSGEPGELTLRRSRRKFKNWAGKEEEGYPGAGWNRTRTKDREVSQGGVSLRGGPGGL